ncbi:hypothetical protein BpHYR1_015863, partial [Brachionus plicatilis]
MAAKNRPCNGPVCLGRIQHYVAPLDKIRLVYQSHDSQTISKQFCKEYLNSLCLDQTYFDSFIKYITSLHVISINSQEWKNSSCNCWFWQKKCICKHIITVAFDLNICDFHEVDLKIDGNRKRGLPKIAKPAWMRSEPPNLSEIDTLTIAPSGQPSTSFIQPHTSSEQLSDLLEQPPPSQEVSQPKTMNKK